MVMILALIEGSALVAVICATSVVRARPLLGDWTDAAAVLAQAVAIAVCCTIASYYSGFYDPQIVRSPGELASRLFQSSGLTFLLLAGLYMLFPNTKIVESPFGSSLLIIAGLLLPLRAAAYCVMRSRLFVERVLILGTSPLARQLVEEIEAQPHCRYAIAGVVHDGIPPERPPFRYPLLGPLEHLGQIVEKVRPDRIIVALAERRRRLPVRQLLQCRGRGVLVEDGVEVYERLTGKVAIEFLTPSSLIFCKGFRKPRLTLAVGRGISLIAAVVGLLGLAPLFGLIALAIKVDSRGPVFFVQDRVGKGGKLFKFLKFRTMHPAQGERSEWVRDNGDRLTRVGKWLRKFRLDELPQFVNILRGDMNLVGPRPHPVSNFELFVLVLRNAPECGEQIPYYSLRAMVRPGLTGWAQVRFRYANDVNEEVEKMRYDLYYLKHMSLRLDLRVLLETVKVVLSGREAREPSPTGARWAVERGGNGTSRGDRAGEYINAPLRVTQAAPGRSGGDS